MFVERPPMGWNSWNTFGGAINETLFMEMADKIVELGLDKIGYNYVVIDDCWSKKERDENGRLVPDPEKFPHGMKYLSDYIHSKGLKFGMYTCSGHYTCAGFPGSFGHEYEDAETFAEWGVDLLKDDNCYQPMFIPTEIRFKRMGLALQNCGRDILFSACTAGKEDTRVWINETGAQMWRSTEDISDNFESIRDHIWQEIKTMEYNVRGCFNDLDMLVVGMNGEGNVGLGGCTFDEYKLHFAFWCLFGSPLFIGGDLRKMSDECINLLTHRDLLRINQDRSYNQPFIVGKREKDTSHKDAYYTYDKLPYFTVAKYLDDGKIALGLFNLERYTVSGNFNHISPEFLGLPQGCGKHMKMREVFSDEIFECRDSNFVPPPVPPHSCLIYIIDVVDD